MKREKGEKGKTGSILLPHLERAHLFKPHSLASLQCKQGVWLHIPSFSSELKTAFWAWDRLTRSQPGRAAFALGGWQCEKVSEE